ncbi:MAG: 30S ribosomal protein S18 [Caldilineaceae bacterium]
MTEQNPTAGTPKTSNQPAATPAKNTPQAAPGPRRQQEQRPRPAPPVVPDDEENEDEEIEIPDEFSLESVGRPRRVGTSVRLGDIDYKNIPVLARFLDGRGRILSRRKTRVSAKVQRRIVKAIKRARHLALLPYTADQSRIVRKRR